MTFQNLAVTRLSGRVLALAGTATTSTGTTTIVPLVSLFLFIWTCLLVDYVYAIAIAPSPRERIHIVCLLWLSAALQPVMGMGGATNSSSTSSAGSSLVTSTENNTYGWVHAVFASTIVRAALSPWCEMSFLRYHQQQRRRRQQQQDEEEGEGGEQVRPRPGRVTLLLLPPFLWGSRILQWSWGQSLHGQLARCVLHTLPAACGCACTVQLLLYHLLLSELASSNATSSSSPMWLDYSQLPMLVFAMTILVGVVLHWLTPLEDLTLTRSWYWCGGGIPISSCCYHSKRSNTHHHRQNYSRENHQYYDGLYSQQQQQQQQNDIISNGILYATPSLDLSCWYEWKPSQVLEWIEQVLRQPVNYSQLPQQTPYHHPSQLWGCERNTNVHSSIAGGRRNGRDTEATVLSMSSLVHVKHQYWLAIVGQQCINGRHLIQITKEDWQSLGLPLGIILELQDAILELRQRYPPPHLSGPCSVPGTYDTVADMQRERTSSEEMNPSLLDSYISRSPPFLHTGKTLTEHDLVEASTAEERAQRIMAERFGGRFTLPTLLRPPSETTSAMVEVPTEQSTRSRTIWEDSNTPPPPPQQQQQQSHSSTANFHVTNTTSLPLDFWVNLPPHISEIVRRKPHLVQTILNAHHNKTRGEENRHQENHAATGMTNPVHASIAESHTTYGSVETSTRNATTPHNGYDDSDVGVERDDGGDEYAGLLREDHFRSHK